jgi:hypothetical protein
VPGAGRDGKQPFLAIDNAGGLLALIQVDVIELHPNGGRADRAECPDQLVFDLDPAECQPFARGVEAAHELKKRLQQVGLLVVAGVDCESRGWRRQANTRRSGSSLLARAGNARYADREPPKTSA